MLIMTQEQKNLLLKDLSARLPYGVKIYLDDCPNATLVGVINGGIILHCDKSDYTYNTHWKIEYIKPYLFPLSSMTEEQLKEMQEIIGNPDDACISVNTSGLELWLNFIDTDPTIWLDTIFEVQDWLNKNHFDYRDLIPKGLAIDATGLNIY